MKRHATGPLRCDSLLMVKPLPDEEILEADWQRTVLDLAKMMGWRVAHFRSVLTRKGWQTPVAADGAGFPDLFLARDRLVAIELKTEKGKLSDAQKDWIRALLNAQVEVYVCRPRHLEQLAEILRYRDRSIGRPFASPLALETRALVSLDQ